jgi:gluconokinase
LTIDGDEYHPAENVARMAAGVHSPTTERIPWLARQSHPRCQERRSGLVIACPRSSGPIATFFSRRRRREPALHLFRALRLLAERLASRRGHFMPPTLLDSQLAALEEPTHDEHTWV